MASCKYARMLRAGVALLALSKLQANAPPLIVCGNVLHASNLVRCSPSQPAIYIVMTVGLSVADTWAHKAKVNG